MKLEIYCEMTYKFKCSFEYNLLSGTVHKVDNKYLGLNVLWLYTK